MSGKPAEKFNIKKRGIIKEGNFADVIVINPDTIEDLATPENPYQYSKGIDYMVVNGKMVLNNGKIEEAKAGEIIRKKSGIF